MKFHGQPHREKPIYPLKTRRERRERPLPYGTRAVEGEDTPYISINAENRAENGDRGLSSGLVLGAQKHRVALAVVMVQFPHFLRHGPSKK
jgi:hypothetical protein